MRIDQNILFTIGRLMQGLRRRVRTLYYSRVLKSMGKGCQICDDVCIFGPEHISMGNGVIVNEGVILQSCNGATITIGNQVGLSYGVNVLTGGLEFSKGVALHNHVSASVVIEDETWIGARAIVLPGVTIGFGSVVAAGAVVTHDVPSRVVVAGVPANVVRIIEDAEKKTGETQ